jgi:peptidyl-prolyl cis-trans isomerase C
MSSVPRPSAARIAPALLALLAALLLASCGQDSRVLARVGSKAITVSEFLDVARSAREQYPWLPDSAKRVLLDDMIRRELMLQEAAQRGITRDTLLEGMRRRSEEELLVTALTEQLAPRNVPVSTAEVAAYYDWHRTESQVQIVYASSPGAAAAALAQLRAGTPFDQVAQAFNAMSPVPPDGNIGFVPGGGMLEPLDSAVRTAKIGEIVGPLRVGTRNWFIARVLARRPAKLPPLATIQEDLRTQLSQRKNRARIQQVIEALGTAYRIDIDPNAAPELYMRANGADSSSHAADDRLALGRFSSDQASGAYTMADAMHDLEATGERPDFSSVPALQRWIESKIMRRVVIAEARRRHLNEEPATAKRVRQQVEQAVLQSIYDSEVTGRIQIDDAELEAEYYRRAGPNAPPFAAVPQDLRQQLRSMAGELKRDELLRRFTDELRRKYPVSVNEALLRRIAWPLPAITTPEPEAPPAG